MREQPALAGAWKQGPSPSGPQQQTDSLAQVLGLLMSIQENMQDVHRRLHYMLDEFERRIEATERFCAGMNRPLR